MGAANLKYYLIEFKSGSGAITSSIILRSLVKEPTTAEVMNAVKTFNHEDYAISPISIIEKELFTRNLNPLHLVNLDPNREPRQFKNKFDV